jgi:hypothetical protein
MRLGILGAGIALFAAIGPAQAQNFAIGAQIGTTGVGAEAQYQFAPGWVLRGTADWLGYGDNQTYEAIRYRGRLHFATAGAFVDWHPFESWFLLSGGAYFGQRKLSLSAAPATPITIDNIVYTPLEVGRLDGSVKMGPAQPFLGLGIDNTFFGQPGLGFKLMAGAAYGGSPSVKMKSSGGTLTNNPIFQSHLDNERDQIRKDAEDYKFFPVVYFGLTYGL